MTMARVRQRLSFLLIASVLGLVVCACDSGSQEVMTPRASFEKDAESVRFVRSIREGLNQQRRPPSEEIQKLKVIANKYPDEPFIEELLISLLPALKDWDGLAVYYEHKSALDTEDRSMLARVYIKLADYGRARDVIESVVQEQPMNVEANSLLGRALYFFGEYDRASECYDRVWDSIVSERRVGDITYRAMIHFDEGQAERAVEMLKAGLEDSPDTAVMHNALSRVLAAQGKLDEAEVHSARVHELQKELSRVETSQMLQAARTFSLNRALQAGDMPKCQRLIFEYLPDSDPAFQEDLYRFLESLYRVNGREDEIPAVLERARQEARKGN